MLYRILLSMIWLGTIPPEDPIREQFNGFAEKFSELVNQDHQDSGRAYFRYFDFPLKNQKLLDLGCGNGYDLAYMKSKGAIVYGLDTSEEMIQIAQKKVPSGQFKKSSCENIPFPDHFFDIVISKWTFQICPHIDPIYKEIARVLKPKGQLIFLSGHPIRQYMEKKQKKKDYFQKEVFHSVFFDGKVSIREYSHTLNEYLSPTFFELFSLESYEEGFDSLAEKVDGAIYPSYFIIKAKARL